MDREKVIRGLKALNKNGECVSQTLVLEEAIRLLQATPVIKVFCNDGGVLDCSTLAINGDEIVADDYRTLQAYEVDHIEAGEV